MKTHLNACGLVLVALVAAGASFPAPAGQQGRRPRGAERQASAATLGNLAIEATWTMSKGAFKPGPIADRMSAAKLEPMDEAFSVTFGDGKVVRASDMKVTGTPRLEPLDASPQASRLAARLAGRQLLVYFAAPDGRFRATWRGILRDGSRYIRQELTLAAGDQDLAVTEVALLDGRVPGAKVVGTVQGSPVVAGDAFLGFEHPMSRCQVDGDRVRCSLAREVPLRAGQEIVCSSVVGFASPGQLRRDFLAYLERERAHPYRTFLHYNSWYDLGYFSPYDEAGALNRIEAYGSELVRKRGVTIDSFLFDDGWDDPQSLWNFGSGFPRGFAAVAKAAAGFGFAPGVWLSPWGGYSKPREQRLAFGRQQGFETNQRGFALSGPVYYKRFRDVCLEMILKYGVNQFKFDGIGRASGTVPGSRFGSDFEAAIALIGDLRGARPDLYVNLTTGTWPSPFWLQYADSIWRGGEDHAFAGVGPDRERWITYRDADTYAHVVQAGPLYPITSLMLHGLIYAAHAKGLTADPQNDFGREVRSYFGTGTQLQEMYVTPGLLTGENWNTLAEAAKWSRQNAAILVDTHWVGGDPAKLEVYGWASWTVKKAILVLRNPGDRPQRFTVDPARAFELPPGAAKSYEARSPWVEDRGKPALTLTAGQPFTFDLQPFEVLALDAMPR